MQSAIYSGMPRSRPPVTLSTEQQQQIEQWLAAMGTPQQIAVRCRIIIGLGGGETEAAIAVKLGINRKTVRLWRSVLLRKVLIAFGTSRRAGDARPHVGQIASRLLL